MTGKTASGKDTIISRILKQLPSYKKVLTTTSRLPRDNEQNGVDYIFISENEFIEQVKQEEFLEYVKYGGNYYGTQKAHINTAENLIWKIDPSMAGKAKKLFPNCKVIYINTSDEIVLNRLIKRGISNEEVQKRIADDREFVAQFKDKYDFIIENVPGKLDETIDKIIEILK